MALTSEPARLEIFDEFGTATGNPINNKSLKQMYGIVFDGDINNGANFSRLDFGGKGQPEGQTIAPTSLTAFGGYLRMDLTLIGAPNGAYYYFKWWEGHGSEPSNPFTTPVYPTSNTGYKQYLVQDFDSETQYSYRGVVYNAFNDDQFDHKNLNIYQFTTPQAPLVVPDLQTVLYLGTHPHQSDSHLYNLEWTIPTTDVDYYEWQFREVGTFGWSSTFSFGNSSVNGSNPYNYDVVVYKPSGIPSSGLQFRMRAIRDTDTTAWSNIVSE